ncbi:hypothetical protein M4D79_28420 [Mycolicibacterium novocastrense]|nr:hypothetical protein M4D79_28420 [Mycolicibacterium novocastrense]
MLEQQVARRLVRLAVNGEHALDEPASGKAASAKEPRALLMPQACIAGIA